MRVGVGRRPRDWAEQRWLWREDYWEEGWQHVKVGCPTLRELRDFLLCRLDPPALAALPAGDPPSVEPAVAACRYVRADIRLRRRAVVVAETLADLDVDWRDRQELARDFARSTL